MTDFRHITSDPHLLNLAEAYQRRGYEFDAMSEPELRRQVLAALRNKFDLVCALEYLESQTFNRTGVEDKP